MKNYLLFILVLISNNVFACFCDFVGGFAYSHQYADLVVYGEAVPGSLRKVGNEEEFKFKIVQKFRGLERNEIITIHGGNGADCNGSAAYLYSENKLVLALSRSGNNINGNYFVDDCGENFIKVEGNQGSGNFYQLTNSDSLITLSLDKIRDIIEQPEEYPIKGPKITVNSELLYSALDYPPLLPLNANKLNTIINNKVKLPNELFKQGDSFLVHVKILYNAGGKFFYNGIEELHYNPNDQLLVLTNKELKPIFKNIENWKQGSDRFNEVIEQIYIPVLLKR